MEVAFGMGVKIGVATGYLDRFRLHVTMIPSWCGAWFAQAVAAGGCRRVLHSKVVIWMGVSIASG